jgi:hypothetical protein
MKVRVFILVIIPSLLLNFQYVGIFAHSFTTDDSIYLLTLIKKTETELDLAKDAYPSNITLSLDHTDNAARLVADTFYTDEDVANDNDFTQRYNKEIDTANATSHALVIATLIDEALREYSDSIDLSFDMTNMSNLLYILPKNGDQQSTNRNSLDENNMLRDFLESGNRSVNNYLKNSTESIDYKEINKIFSSNNSINQYSNYQTAVAIALEINELFQTNLKYYEGLNKNNIKDITKLEEDLNYFYSLLNNNSSPAELMKIVHLDIQPTLQKVFNLKTIYET